MKPQLPVFAAAGATPVESAVGAFVNRRAGERIVRNFAPLLADRLIVANTRGDPLTAH